MSQYGVLGVTGSFHIEAVGQAVSPWEKPYVCL